jgi:hypothetical protein
VLNTPTDESVTCASCEFRYPRCRGVCIMCGTPAPTAAPVHVSSPGGGAGRNGADPEPQITIPPALQTVETPVRRKSIPIIVSALVVLSALFGLLIRNWGTPTSASQMAESTNTSLPANPESKATPYRAKSPTSGVQLFVPAKFNPVESTNPTTQEDPAELWKRVRRGSTPAELTLAKLYLEGTVVPQNCEQTHLLLLAASRKGSKAAGSLLAGAYAEQCQ